VRSSSGGQRRLLLEQRPERRRLEQAPLRAVAKLELVEDRAPLCRPRRLAGTPLLREPVPQLLEPVGGVEDPPDDELRRHRAVPAVLLEPERHVVATLPAKTIEVAAHAEGDRRARVAAVLPHAKPEMLAVSNRSEVGELAAVDQQGHPGVAEAERREPGELGSKSEVQLRP